MWKLSFNKICTQATTITIKIKWHRAPGNLFSSSNAPCCRWDSATTPCWVIRKKIISIQVGGETCVVNKYSPFAIEEDRMSENEREDRRGRNAERTAHDRCTSACRTNTPPPHCIRSHPLKPTWTYIKLKLKTRSNTQRTYIGAFCNISGTMKNLTILPRM